MRKILTGTALALVFATAPALAGSTSTSASSETVPSQTVEDKAVSEPTMNAGDNTSTTVDEGTKATGASSMTTTNAEGEPMSTTGKMRRTASRQDPLHIPVKLLMRSKQQP